MTKTRAIAIALVLVACSKDKDKDAKEGEGEVGTAASVTPSETGTMKVATPSGTVEASVGGQKVTITDPSGKSGTVTIEGDGKSARIESAEGTAEFGSGKLPDGFPLPVPQGATVASSITGAASGQGKGWHVQLMVKQPVAELTGFYEKALADKGLKVTKVAQNMGTTEMIILAGEKKEVSAGVTITKGPDGTMVTVSWQDR